MLFRHASQYMVASAIAATFGFLSTAAFTRLLSPDQYGIYVVGVGVAGFVSSILFTWVRYSVMRFQSEGEQQDLRLTALAGYGVSAATAPLVFFALARFSHVSWQETGLAIILALGVGLFELGQELLRARFQVRAFVTGVALRAAMSFGLCIAIIKLDLGGRGQLAGAALAYFLTAAISARSIWRAPRARVNFAKLKLFFRLGAVFTLTGFVVTFQSSLDRLFLAWHSSDAYAGLYGASADLVRQIILMPGGSVAAAAFPLVVASFTQFGAFEARTQLKRFGEILVAVLAPSTVGLALTAPYLASFLLGPAFRETAALIVPILSVGWMFQSISQYYIHLSFHLAKRPELSLLQGLGSAIVNVACIFPLTDSWGLAGAAASFLISEAAGIGIGLALTRFSHPLPLLMGPLARILLACGLMACVVMTLEQSLPTPSLAAFAVLAASGIVAYTLAAIGLNICDARTLLRGGRIRIFPTAVRAIGRRC
jgi:O-antigen/teichoic acid export membrane protein